MPPWVARQWHAWGRSLPLSGDLGRIQHCRLPATLRCYAQHSPKPLAGPRLQAANSALIIPSSVANTRPEDLIAHIPAAARAREPQDHFAVFLVTPSFATWLLDDHAFVHKALRQSYSHLLGQDDSAKRTQIHALCAVVDRLPVARPMNQIQEAALEDVGKSVQNDTTPKQIHEPISQDAGHEGIAYAALPLSDSIPSSLGVGQDKAAISFFVEHPGAYRGHFSDSVRLPLANTVFQTGSPTTMTYSTWESAEGSGDLILKDKRNISHHGIRVHLDEGSSSLSIPLVPLSKPREVDASMGNILRRVKGPDGTSITASQELEEHVPKYFSARGEASQATTVWALVMDRDQMLDARKWTDLMLHQARASHAPRGEALPNQAEETRWEALWKQEPTSWSPLMAIALKTGARLHRVLSGGGGWGKKAGLLSLDPIPVVEAEAANEAGDFEFDGPGDLQSALQQVAHEGEYVQFFIAPSVPVEDGRVAAKKMEKGTGGLELGTIPSTTDAMPLAPGQTETADTNEISVYRHTFGALTEGGMVLSRTFERDSIATTSRTTVDVPFSRFSIAKWKTGKVDEEADSDHKLASSNFSSRPCDLTKSPRREIIPRFLGPDSYDRVEKSIQIMLHRRIKRIKQERARVKAIEDSLERSSGNMTALVASVRDVLDIINLRAKVTLDANNSAVDLYELHVQLRNAFAVMERARSGSDRAKIRGRLLGLRHYRKNLFASREHCSREYIRARLQQMEKYGPRLRVRTVQVRRISVPRLRLVRAWSEDNSAEKKRLLALSEKHGQDRKSKKMRAPVEGRKRGRGSKKTQAPAPNRKQTKEGLVRKMDKEHQAVKALDNLVRGWLM